jgi:hypothetical protein
MQATYQKSMVSFFHTGSHTTMALYILEQPSSFSTSWIRLSWPRSRGRLSLLLVLFPQVYSSLLWPTQYLAICSNGSCLALNPFLAYWQPNTSVQVNNTSALHHIHTDTHIYITSILLFIIFFTLLHTSSTPSGRPAAPDPSRRVQLLIYMIFLSMVFTTLLLQYACRKYSPLFLHFFLQFFLLFLYSFLPFLHFCTISVFIATFPPISFIFPFILISSLKELSGEM